MTNKIILTPEERDQKRREQMKKYQQSERGKQKMKEAQERYEKSERGKNTRKEYYNKISEKNKI